VTAWLTKMDLSWGTEPWQWPEVVQIVNRILQEMERREKPTPPPQSQVCPVLPTIQRNLARHPNNSPVTISGAFLTASPGLVHPGIISSAPAPSTVTTVLGQSGFTVTMSSSAAPAPVSVSLIRSFPPSNLHQQARPGRGCGFCKTNGEVRAVWAWHNTKEGGVVTCPQLRRLICSHCGATGDEAHTAAYCPLQLVPATPLPTLLRQTARTSDGRPRCVRRNSGKGGRGLD